MSSPCSSPTVAIARKQASLSSKKRAPIPALVLLIVAGYPTPPPSPDLEILPSDLPATDPQPSVLGIDIAPTVLTSSVENTSSIQITIIDEYSNVDNDSQSGDSIDGDYPFVRELFDIELFKPRGDDCVDDGLVSPPAFDFDIEPLPQNASLPPSPVTAPIPNPILLNTAHRLSRVSTFRLTSPSSLLSALGGNRVLSLDSCQSVCDIMSYTAAAAAAHARTSTEEEEEVETLLGGERTENKMNSLNPTLRSHR